MTVKRLRLRNFRNYASQEVDFSDKLNMIYGDNAQGKTNVLEAIFLCSTGRSHRTQKDAELIKYGESSAVVEVVIDRKDYGECRVEIEIQRSGRKGILINGVPQRRAGDLLGRLNCVIFSPEDLAIIKDEPQIRRRFLDMFISQIKPAYYYNLQRYLNTLRQRNALLRQLKDNPRLADTIGAWDEPLAGLGAKVMRERAYFIGRISEFAATNHAVITGGREALVTEYDPSLKCASMAAIDPPRKFAVTAAIDPPLKYTAAYNMQSTEDLSFEDRNLSFEERIRNEFLRALEQSLQSDIIRASTQIGPHKDDISCTINGRNLRLYGSQGQQRTAALALKMAQVDVMADEIGDIPVLLLDDVMSELDRSRQDNLSKHMKNAQTFMTGTETYAETSPSDNERCTVSEPSLYDAGQKAISELCMPVADAYAATGSHPEISYYFVENGSIAANKGLFTG